MMECCAATEANAELRSVELEQRLIAEGDWPHHR